MLITNKMREAALIAVVARLDVLEEEAYGHGIDLVEAMLRAIEPLLETHSTKQQALLERLATALAQIASTETMTWEEKGKLPFNWAIAKRALTEYNQNKTE